MESRLAEVRDYQELSMAMLTAKEIISKDYLYRLNQFEVNELPTELKNINIAEYTRLYKFRKIITDKNENMLERLVTVLNAAYSSNATVLTIIKGYGNYTEYYLGVVSKDINQEVSDIGTQGETFKGALNGNFPGLELEQLNDSEIKKLSTGVFSHDYITSVSGIASIRNEKEKNIEKYVQGIEHLVDSLQGREYSILVIADPVDYDEITIAKAGYVNLYTQLSPFQKTALSFNESESVTATQSQTKSFSTTIGESTSLTQNYSKSSGWTKTDSHGNVTNKDSGRMIGTIAGTVIGGVATILTGGAAAPLAAAYVASNIGGNLGSGLLGSESENSSESFSETQNITESTGKTKAQNNSETSQNSNSKSQATGESHGRTLQFSNENKEVKELLKTVDKHIERLEKCESYGAFNCATYVITSDPETNAIVSNGYSALMKGDTSSLQTSYINKWNAQDKNSSTIKEYLKLFSHPIFISDTMSEINVTPASIVNSYEVAVNIGLPKKSINGLPVIETASFGRNIFDVSVNNSRSLKGIELGKIYHMGNVEQADVSLDMKSLSMHTFITGSTGSGKSNTVYQILRELNRNEIKFLVIEPAKGEYKNVFGNEIAKVYGTNPYYAPLLKLNPFKFPKQIHVLEHIDKLIEIFNASWPMYAAMPAVLKDALENAYIDAGWNLNTSINKYEDNLFPTFTDVLSELNKVVEKSAFSQEVKDNYIGSLATRIRSLTNGIYGQIFENNEIGDKALFDENVIVDLSRVGSMETKAMIMGILIMRLQEYRMSGGGMNLDLKHVTVLEEAHNLLKRTSMEQSSESSNLLGKAVEMLSNAIAEVRTYGEGFVIVDQAPGLLDMSVIRNTNTKIIMRLPDAEDRNLVGKTANLSEQQIKELAKIPTGIAAVYQNNWLEPVLSQVNYQKVDGDYKYSSENVGNKAAEAGRIVVNSLIDRMAGEKLEYNTKELIEYLSIANLSTNTKVKALGVIRKSKIKFIEDIQEIVYDILYPKNLEMLANEAESIEEWRNTLIYGEESSIAEFDKEKQNVIIECILRNQIDKEDRPEEYIETWNKFIRGEVL